MTDHDESFDGVDEAEDEAEEWLREAARAPWAALPDLLGERLGRYEIMSVLGAGGMGIVYLARDVQLDRVVALKVLPADRLGDDAHRKRFLREARLAARLEKHPAIATIYDVGEMGDRAFLAMEYVEGITLREKLSTAPDGHLSLDEALAIGMRIAGGLEVAHAAGVVHRDIKPENVIVSTHDLTVKILDFGAAKALSSSSRSTASMATREGSLIGTPAYMSPEQARGSREIDARSDIFSLGIVLYEMVTGERPFRGKTPLDVLIALDRDEPEAPSKKSSNARTSSRDRAFDALIARCLQKDKAKRFASARELGDALERIARGLPPDGPSSSARKWGLSLLFALAAFGGVVLFVVARSGTSNTEQRAPSHEETARTNIVAPSSASSTSFASSPPAPATPEGSSSGTPKASLSVVVKTRARPPQPSATTMSTNATPGPLEEAK